MDDVYSRVIKGLREELQKAVDESSQTEVAARCGTTPATIQRVLRGKRGENLPFKTVLMLCMGMGVDLGELVSPQPGEDKEKIKTLLSQISKLIANQ